MTNETVKKLTVAFSFILSLVSSLLALATGGDIFYVIVERFFIVFAISAFLMWIVLSVISSVVIGAARDSVAKLTATVEPAPDSAQEIADALRKIQDEDTKGTSLDLTSAPLENMLSTSSPPNDDGSPEIKEFEPFKPKRIETDTDNVAQ
ncbi:MAG TPA: hypothetical protein DE036_10955 [Actinobacteria bacterium]|nr:hypothetical protein [Actinomycetota bacterium]